MNRPKKSTNRNKSAQRHACPRSVPRRNRANLAGASKRARRKVLTIKQSLLGELANWMTEQQMTPPDIAAWLATTESVVLAIRRGNVTSLSIERLVDLLLMAGKRIRVGSS